MSVSEGHVSERDQAEIDLRLIGGFRECGHFLHYKTGEKSGQRRILIKILTHGSLTQRHLGQIMKLSSGAMSEILAKMEAEGLVKRVKSTGDKRQVELTLTDRGTAAAVEVLKADARLACQLFGCLSKSEKEQLVSVLKKLLESWNVLTIEEGNSEAL